MTSQKVSPGLIALVLVALLAFSLSFSIDRSAGALDLAYSQVMVVVCGQGYGTAWFVNSEYALTAYHVVAECADVTLVRGDWSSQGRVVAYDAARDLAVIRVDSPPSWAKGIPLTPQVAVGDNIYVIGYPIQLYQETNDIKLMSQIPRVASGTVSWLHPEEPIFQFDIPTDAGNSGGPVVSKETGGAVGLVIYARPGVVSEGYFGLRMDYIASFLDNHGIEYRVAEKQSIVFYLGLGIVAVLIFLALRGGGSVKRALVPVLVVALLLFPVPMAQAQEQAYLVVGVDTNSGVGGQWRAVPLCTVGYDLPDVPGLQQPVILVAENRHVDDNWAIYHGYRMYNDIYGGYVYTVTGKIVELPFDDDKLYRPPAGAIHSLFWFVIGPNGEVMVNDGVVGQIPCQKASAAYGDGVATRVLAWNWTVPSPVLPGPGEPPLVNTTTPQPTQPGGDEAVGDVLSVSPLFLGVGVLAGLLLAIVVKRW